MTIILKIEIIYLVMEEKKTTLLPEYYYSLDEITELLREN
jgi:hypothetical protein